MTGINFHFRTIDYIIFILTLCLSVGIGLFYASTGGKQKTTSEYLMVKTEIRKNGVFTFRARNSSISSVFNSLAAVVLEDFVRQNKRWEFISEEEAAKISKVIAMAVGPLCLIPASLGDYFGPLIQSSEYNVCVFTGALFVIFALGLFFPWTTSLGTLIGATLGLSLGLWLSIGSQLNRYVPPHPPISVEGCPVDANIINVTSQFNDVDVLEPYKISYVWLTTWVVFCGVVIGVLASFITGPGNLNSVDPQLLAPITNFILKKIYKKKFRGYTESREISTVDVSLIVKPISEYAVVNATRRNKIPPERFVSLIPSTQV